MNGEALRDDGIDRVSREQFTVPATELVKMIPQGEYTGEDIRCFIEEGGVFPHHQNAWGAFIMGLVRRKWLTDTGRVKRAKLSSGHKRRLPVYDFKLVEGG